MALVHTYGVPAVRKFETCRADLPVDGSYDRCAHIHAGDEAVVEVAVEDESLQDGREEHEEGQRVAPPVRGALLFREGYQHPVSVTEGNGSFRMDRQQRRKLRAAAVKHKCKGNPPFFTSHALQIHTSKTKCMLFVNYVASNTFFWYNNVFTV